MIVARVFANRRDPLPANTLNEQSDGAFSAPSWAFCGQTVASDGILWYRWLPARRCRRTRQSDRAGTAASRTRTTLDPRRSHDEQDAPQVRGPLPPESGRFVVCGG